MRRYKLWPIISVMRRTTPGLLLSVLALMACKPGAAQGTAAATSVATARSPLVTAAQTVLNQTNQGRACTTLTKRQLEHTIHSGGAEYAKRQVLIKHGLTTVTMIKDGTLTWGRYAEPTLKEADGKGVFITDPQVGLYYCFGRWVVTAAEVTDKFPASAGTQVVIATIELRDAPAWVRTDSAASALMRPTISGDPATLGTLDEFDKLVPGSLIVPNRVPVEIPKT